MDHPKATELTGWNLRLGRLLWLLAVVLVVLTLSEIWPRNFYATYGEWVVSRTRPFVGTFMEYFDFVRFVTTVESLSAVTALAMGLLVFRFKSRDRLGLFVSAFLILLAPWYLSGNMEEWRLPAWVPLGEALAFLQAAATMVTLVLFIYLFPDGRFVPRWTRWTALLGVGSVMLFLFSLLFPVRVPEAVSDVLWLIFTIPFMGSLAAAGIGQAHRYHTEADPVQRQQMKWVVFGLGSYIASMFVSLLMSFLDLPNELTLVELLVRMLAAWLIPLTIGISMLRYRLWDVDVWIGRTLVYGGLTLAIVLVYSLLVGGLTGLLLGVPLRAESALAFAVTAIVAFLALSLRDRLQRGANRLLYGERDDPMALLARLGGSLEAAAGAQDALPTIAASVAQALRLPYAAVALRRGDEFEIIGAAGTPPGTGLAVFPLTYGGETVGRLLAAPRTAGEKFSAADRRVLEQVARQAGAGLHAVQLTADLRRSREQLVAAREEERRRLHRDLHDGLGPQLASLALKADAARNRLANDAPTAERLLDEIKTQAQAAVADIRRLVYDLRPSALDQLGLAAALREHAASLNAASTMQVTVEAAADPPAMPAAVEVAAYRIALEALTNAARHGQAQRCLVRLAFEPGLRLEILDDGRGLPDERPAGVGLVSMRERAEELGGTCRIERRPEGGTRVMAELPVGV